MGLQSASTPMASGGGTTLVAAGGPGYETFLKAQEGCPTLVLAHAKIGDDGAREVAHFVSRSPHLKRLDLTGCDITSAGAVHIAEGLRISITIESLVLRHNGITSGPAGEAGLAAICQAVCDSTSLRHLDLRSCGLSGVSAAQQVGSVIRSNKGLSHLELSWNPLGVPGGQVLLESIRASSGLFDCQLTGCSMAEATMKDIAELLLRNRKVKNFSLDAGPYMGTWSANTKNLRQLGDGQVRDVPHVLRSQGEESAVNYPARYISQDVAGNSVVSKEQTEEMIGRLLEWRRLHLQSSTGNTSVGSARVHELMEYLTQGQKQVDELAQTAEDSRHRAVLIEQGFTDREVRYRANLVAGRDKLHEYAKEYSKMQAALRRMVDDLSLMRQDLEVCQEELKRAKRHAEDDEDRDLGKLALVKSETRGLESRLSELKDKGEHLDFETNMLRKRAEQVREGVINELET